VISITGMKESVCGVRVCACLCVWCVCGVFVCVCSVWKVTSLHVPFCQQTVHSNLSLFSLHLAYFYVVNENCV
jgi:hypothetical protein